jgi:hypothetical protein
MTIFRFVDGTVIPSYLGVRPRGEAEDTGAFTNATLRLGEVLKRHNPGSDKSLTRKFYEYEVEVQHRDGSGPAVNCTYTNCLVANLFGNGADLCRYTLRLHTQRETQNEDIGTGAKVLLLCLNGENAKAYIIGGIRDVETDSTKDDPQDGHNYFWEFNGIRQTVDDDGQYTMLFRGATAVNGAPAHDATADNDSSDANAGTQFIFDKGGGISLLSGSDGTTDSFGVPGSIRLVMDAKAHELSLVSGGTSLIQAHEDIDVKTDANVVVTADKIKLGSKDAAEALVLGTTYRQEQRGMHNNMMSTLTAVSTTIRQLAVSHNAVGAALVSAGTAMLAGPTGNIVAAPFITLASTQMMAMGVSLQTMAQQMDQIKSFINSFESNDSDFLSDHHTTQK